MIYQSSVEDLHADHERWVAQGLMTPEQMARIEAREQRRNREELLRPAVDRGGAHA